MVGGEGGTAAVARIDGGRIEIGTGRERRGRRRMADKRLIGIKVKY